MNTQSDRNFRSIRVIAAAWIFSSTTVLAVTSAAAIDIGGSIGSGGSTAGVGGSFGGGRGASFGGSAKSADGSVGGASASIGRARSGGNVNLSAGDTRLGLGVGNEAQSVNDSKLNGIARAIGGLSTQEQRKIAAKCVKVLAAPQRYPSDTVAVCKALASL